MKQKAIEQIPCLPANAPEKSWKYAASARTLAIGGEEHLLVEVYEKQKLRLRAAYTKADWAVYLPKTETWSKASPTGETLCTIWKETGHYYGQSSRKTWISQEDIRQICRFTGKKETRYRDWLGILSEFEDAIRYDRRARREEKRERRLQERIRNTPPLPDGVEAWAKHFFRNVHYLFYSRYSKHADVCCSACGQTTTVRTAQSDRIEDQNQMVCMPKHGDRGICPACKAAGIWVPRGRSKVETRQVRFYLGMPYGEGGAVIRYLEYTKKIWPEGQAAEDGFRLIGGGETDCLTELARAYYLPKRSRKLQIDYRHWNAWQEEYWVDCNASWGNTLTMREGSVYPETWGMLKGTCLQYSGAEAYYEKAHEMNLVDYMDIYQDYPQLEMLSKLGMLGIARELTWKRCGIIANGEAKSPDLFLGIRKERLKLLREKSGDTGWLHAMQQEKRLEAHWSETELELVRWLNLGSVDLTLILQHIGLLRFANRLRTYRAGTRFRYWETERDAERRRYQETARTYLDYLRMREQLGYDMTNTVYLYPRDLRAAHDAMVAESNKKEADKRKEEAELKYPEIRKQYRKLRNRYFYEADGLQIRPARSASEIIDEGRLMHHCVGGNSYLGKHNRGESHILLLRHSEDPDIPYATIEIKDIGFGFRILQWYQAYDRKPDKEILDPWLDQYLAWLNGEAEQKSRQPAEQPVLMPAI